ncbi:MAG: glycosyltransferase family 2 protein [Elusimicrobia bacterium]|nr:glycosyltransferase family 2 protein [Elusimicrobiota bacterium]
MASVSVVIDNYNYGRFLGQAVESVLDQDFKGEVECIVVDDGSTDESRRVLASFGGRVRAVLQANQGQAMAFNNGFAAATGEFVGLLDADDYWRPTKLSRVIPLFEDAGVGVVEHFLQDVDARGADLPQYFPLWPPSYSLDDFLDRRVELGATSGLVFRKTVLDQVLPIPKGMSYYFDDLLVVKSLLLSRLVNLPERLGLRRLHDSNLCAAGRQYGSPRNLELDMRMRDLFNSEIDPLLARRNLRRTDRYLAEEELEYMRRRILLHMLRGERGRAFNEWLGMLRKHGGRRLGLFRCATCLAALVSPGLYLRAYDAYRGRRLLKPASSDS